MSDVIIGIDPGKKTGLAVLDTETGELIDLQTVDFWGAVDYVHRLGYPIAEIVIEVPNTKAVFHKAAANIKANQRMGANVGSVVREAELLAEGLERQGYPVLRVQPTGKRTMEQFRQIWPEFKGRTNQHNRDAAFMTLRSKKRKR